MPGVLGVRLMGEEIAPPPKEDKAALSSTAEETLFGCCDLQGRLSLGQKIWGGA